MSDTPGTDAALLSKYSGQFVMADFARQLEREIRQMVDKAAAKSLDGYRELGAKCAALEYELEQLRAMAVRYQFLRERFRCNGLHIDGNHSWSFMNPHVAWRGPSIDAAIDSAIKDGK